MLASVSLLALLAGSAQAFWRLPCNKPVVNGLIDPIVSPGKANGHSHTIMGASGINLDSTYDELVASDCTTCKVSADKSAYWIPGLYYQYGNGSFASVDHGGMLVYYLQRGGSNETIKAFPPGLRMLTGDPFARNNSGSIESQAINWNCIDYTQNHPETPGFDIMNCPNGLRAQVFFPACWDGVNLDSADHKSHMAYPDGINNGVCPSSHPVHLISIFYEVYFNVAQFNSLNDGGSWVLSTGDPTGYSLHGDFYNGWNQDILQQAVDQCTNDSGVLEDCGVFTGQNLIISDADANSCSAKDPVGVNVDGVLDFLPNCVAIQPGPQEATPGVLSSGCTPVAGNTGTAPKSPTVASSSPAAASSAQASTAIGSSTTAKVSAASSVAATPTASSSVKPLSPSSSSASAPAASSAAVVASSAAAGETTSVLAGKTGVRAASTAVPTATTEASPASSSAAAAFPSAPATGKTCNAKPKRKSTKPSVHHYRANANRARSF
ncbi:hypothetical protein PENSPDRAFT_601507 [Peniophora sp. CONT]|nr:hypothetical protein PENSPDRAFT_601507 [Peniophora sp. CONT]